MEIASGLGVSRGSVRSAMKILEAYGIIEIKVGDGTYICKSVKNHGLNPLLFTFMLASFPAGLVIAQWAGSRRANEPGAALHECGAQRQGRHLDGPRSARISRQAGIRRGQVPVRPPSGNSADEGTGQAVRATDEDGGCPAGTQAAW
jgi:hypothetical protein